MSVLRSSRLQRASRKRLATCWIVISLQRPRCEGEAGSGLPKKLDQVCKVLVFARN